MKRFSLLFVLAATLATAGRCETFHFTVTADQRSYDAAYDAILAQMNLKIGGQGVFQISPGDVDPPANLRARIDTRMGTSAIWYPGIGNHESETAEDMTWLRTEYNTGQNGRAALKLQTFQDGPPGSVETTYSWDYGNAHFIMLNQYWNGGTAAGSDVAAQGDTVPALRSWLSANLAATDKPVIFVFGHEPAYPKNRHVGDSLDQYPASRDAFWSLLESDPRVKAFICGHTHYYSRHQQPGGRVWQIDVGNAGNDGGDGKTFLDVIVGESDVRFDVWRDNGTGSFALAQSWSVPVTVPAAQPVSSPGAAKALVEGSWVSLTGVVSAAFPGFFYVQDSARSSGIRVDRLDHTVAAGSSVTVTGPVLTTPDGERFVDALQIAPGAQWVAAPLGVVHRDLGGQALGDTLDPLAQQPGIAGGVGLNNVGLLVRVGGVVTFAGQDFFYVDDGSGASEGSGQRGVRVAAHGQPVPAMGARVDFTGISSCQRVNGQVQRLVRAVSGLPRPAFVAYNDTVWTSSQPIAANVTTYGVGGGFTGSTSGVLRDIGTGAATGVVLTLAQSGGVTWQPDPVTGGSDTNPGTDAYAVFGGIVSLSGTIYYGSTGWWVDATFSGLDPAKTYELVTTANRNGSSYADRLTRYTISGADAFTNASSQGVTVTNAGASSDFCTGYNTINGYVARWTGIAPGADGSFTVRAQAAPGGDPVKAYAFDALRLRSEF